jgi:hypothetical protein
VNSSIVRARRAIALGPAASTSTMHIFANAGDAASSWRKARRPVLIFASKVCSGSIAARIVVSKRPLASS